MSSPSSGPSSGPSFGDPYNLERFIEAQADSHDAACRELAAGCKRSHWMWFVFPQLRGLGQSQASRFYGITGLEEARAYLADPVLGSRLRHATQLVLRVEGASAHDIFGSPDDFKLHASMTLFARAADDNAAFASVLQRYFDGEEHRLTAEMLDAP